MSGLVDPKIFKNAISIKDSLSKQQAKDISALYVDWASQIDDLADCYSKKIAPSYSLETLYQQQLKKQVTEMSKQVANGVYSKTNVNLYKVADAVVADNVEWMKQFGLGDDVVDVAFSGISQSTVNALLTGSVYGEAGSWSLSKSIWGDNQDTLKKIYQIVAQGSVMQMPTGEIAKKLEEFVNPYKQFKWNGPSGYPPVYGKKVDYNAQRLARTLLQHCYQESFIAVSQKNPLITQVKYIANGSRACDVCKARDGKVYAITKVPLDHPNGMCVLEPVVNTSQVDKLAAWVKGDLPDKDKKWWDSKMKSYGYDVDAMPAKQVLEKVSEVAKTTEKTADKVAEKAVKKAAIDDAKKAVKTVGKAEGKTKDSVKQAVKKAEVKAEAKKAPSKSGKLPSYKEMLSGLQDKQKTAKVTLDDFLGKFDKDVSNRMKKFTSSVEKNTFSGFVDYSEVFLDIKPKSQKPNNVYQFYKMFKNKLLDVKHPGLRVDEEDGKHAVELYKAIFGEDPVLLKMNKKKVLHEFVMDEESYDKLVSKLMDMLMKGEKAALKKVGVSDGAIEEAKVGFSNFFGFRIGTVNEYEKLADALGKAADDIEKFKKTGILDGIESDKAASLAKKAKEAAEKAAEELKAKQKAAAEKLKDFRKTVFGKDAYSEEAKNKAKNFWMRSEADKFLRPMLDEIWDKLTDEEKFSVWKYTEGSGSFNRPLSGYADGSWNRKFFKGVGNVSWNSEDDFKTLVTKAFKKKFAKDEAGHVDGAKAIANLTTAIENSSLKKSMYLYRGDGIEGFAGLLEGSDISFDEALELLKSKDLGALQKLCEGKQFQSHAFMSTTISTEETSFSSARISYKIYAPEGSHGIYAEPASYYGKTVGTSEKVYKTGAKSDGVGEEAEIILQRGSSFRIKSIQFNEWTNKIDIEMEIADQPDYFITGYEQTIDGGKTLFE